MLVPDLVDLRPGDFVKLRGTGSSAHSGGRAVVVAVHRSAGPPWRVVALDVRYSARGQALRVDVDGAGELVRWDAPWPPAQPAPAERPPVSAGVAHVAPPVTRRQKVLTAAALVLVPLALGGLWAATRPQVEPNPLLVQRHLVEGVRGTGTASPGPPGSPAPSATTRAPATAEVVAYAAGPVPVVADAATGRREVALAGVEVAAGCRDAYVSALLELLPVGQRVRVDGPPAGGSGWFTTDDGIDVNAELVRTGVAVPTGTGEGLAAADAAHRADLLELAADAPRECA